MADKIDMSLDDIIKSKRQNIRGRGGRRGGRGGRGQNNPTSRRFQNQNFRRRRNFGNAGINGKWQHDMYKTNMNLTTPKQLLTRSNNILLANNIIGGPGKLLISNLDFGVTDSDIQELFGEFGALLNAAVHYDRTGRSLGTADVIFERKVDALQAIKKYNNVPLDGRPMNIQFASSDINFANGTINANTSPLNKLLQQQTQKFSPRQQQRRGGGLGGRGRGVRSRPFGRRGARGAAGLRGGRRGNRQNNAKSSMTQAQLDAELDIYNSQMEQ